MTVAGPEQPVVSDRFELRRRRMRPANVGPKLPIANVCYTVAETPGSRY